MVLENFLVLLNNAHVLVREAMNIKGSRYDFCLFVLIAEWKAPSDFVITIY